MKFGLIFSQSVPPANGRDWHKPYKDMLDCLPLAEELGYESCFQVSHHAQKDGLCPGPLIACAAAAAVTSKMRIGTGVLLVPLYAPLKLAEDIAVLDNVSNGRFIFGVAPGYVEEEFAAYLNESKSETNTNEDVIFNQVRQEDEGSFEDISEEMIKNED